MSADRGTTANAVAPDPEVTWQVAFFALVPLALSCMTQPVGRVLDSPAELRFWMRANPLICAADILHYLKRISIDYILEPCWSWRHVRVALADRFRDTDWSAPRPRFEQAAAGRWALLVLSGISCQTIKLVAMRGIPVTQSVALTYAVALVFGEALNVSAEACLRCQGARSAPAADPSSQLWISGTSRALILSVCGYFVLHILHAVPVWWLTANLFTTATNLVNAERLFRPHGLFIFSMILLSYNIVGIIDFGTAHRYLGVGDYMVLPIIFFPLFMLLLFGFEAIFILTMTRMCIFIIVLVGLPPFLYWLGSITFWRIGGSRFGQILGIPGGGLELGSFLLFLVLLVLVVLSYVYVFDGTGTVNPGWLGIFG